jgi:crossover junction endodeoxyribonuclease RusA
MITITLPWPPKALSPNTPGGWRAKAAHRKKAFTDGYWAVKASVSPDDARLEKGVKFSVMMMFYPPDARGRDIDNCHASCKNLLDGMCNALGINDKQLCPVTLDMGLPDKKNPRVEVTLSWS